MQFRAQVDEILTSFEPIIVERGRRYADAGRVTDLFRDETSVAAVVHGTKPYDVILRRTKSGRSDARCSCPAYDRERECKHLAALAWTLRGPKEEKESGGYVPSLFRDVHSIASFFARLSLYAERSLVTETIAQRDSRWSPLYEWWTGRSREHVGHKAEVLARLPEVEGVLATLRGWDPPPVRATAHSEIYEALAEVYCELRSGIGIRHALPGPDDARHPGFVVTFDPKLRVLEARERPTALLRKPGRLALTIPLDPAEPPAFLEHAFARENGADAWELFALRALLVALHDGAEEGVRLLDQELARPLWDHVLDELEGSGRTDPHAREWMFCIVPQWSHYEFNLVAFARSVREAKPGKWKRQPVDALLAEEAGSKEHAIARIALCSGSHRVPSFTLGTPHAHELLRHLADHPRVHLATDRSAGPDGDLVTDILAGPLTMRLARGTGGALVPRFVIDGTELPFPIDQLGAAGRTGDRSRALFLSGHARTRGETYFVSALVPPALRSWVDAAKRLGEALVFPPESVPRLQATTQGLVAAGTIELPREALGAELAFEPRAALRVEWIESGQDTTARVELLIAPRHGAPLVEPGMGPRLFTFESDGARVFVERDRAYEQKLALDTVEAIDAPIRWAGIEQGHTETLEDTIALAAWLDANPLGLTIEVKVGRAPSLTPWSSQSELHVRKIDGWLAFDGALDIGGVKLTVGEILEAARLARRYVRAQGGVFLELSKDVLDKLTPLAVAAELVPRRGDDAELLLHDAFGSFLAEAAKLFGKVHARSLDLEAYRRRFDRRDRRVRPVALEAGTLRTYQAEGVAWILQLATWAPGCVLADDMGLGKTVQTAAVLKARAKKGPALVVAPASVAPNWVAELARFVPSLRVRWQASGRDDLDDLGPRDVIVVSYGLLQRRSAAFAKQPWTTVVIDEAQYVKNATAQRRDAVRALQKEFTIALTGTPLENHLGELFSIVDVVFPSLLGDEVGFREYFRRPIEVHRDGDRLALLGRLLAPFLLRRTRAAVLQELPAREEITVPIELGLEERKRYLALREAIEQQLKKRQKDESAAQHRIALLAALTRLRQLACDVRLVDATYEGPSTKIARVVAIASELAAEGNHALVFSQFTQFLTKVKAALEEAGLRVAYLSGETPATKRQPIIDAFQSGAYDVFCISLLAGGTGLNLTRASYVIHLDPWWNPAAEEQATSRAHRMGQTAPVTVYRLVSRGTIEEAVLKLHGTKKELAAAVLEGKDGTKAITSTELLELLRFGA